MNKNMTLRLKASDWRGRETRGEFWLAESSSKNDEKRERSERCIIYDYFFSPILHYFLQHATSVFVFNLLFDFRYYRWKIRETEEKEFHCNWHSILIMRFFFSSFISSERLIAWASPGLCFVRAQRCLEIEELRGKISIIQFASDRDLSELVDEREREAISRTFVHGQRTERKKKDHWR